VFTADELNWTELQFANYSTVAEQPITFVTPTRVTNNASSNWVSLVQVSSVEFSSAAVNSSTGKHVFRTPVRQLQFSSVPFSLSAAVNTALHCRSGVAVAKVARSFSCQCTRVAAVTEN